MGLNRKEIKERADAWLDEFWDLKWHIEIMQKIIDETDEFLREHRKRW